VDMHIEEEVRVGVVDPSGMQEARCLPLNQPITQSTTSHTIRLTSATPSRNSCTSSATKVSAPGVSTVRAMRLSRPPQSASYST